VLLLMLGCAGEGGEDGTFGLSYSDFVPPPGWIAEFIPQEAPEEQPLLVHINDEGGWDLRRGDRWADAEVQGSWQASEDEGYVVNGDLLLPPTLVQGETTDDVTITALGEATAWYGTFEMAVTVDRESGRLATEQVFARDIGPVVLTLDGFRWELAAYE
jgi:hypothetical protein